MAFCVRYPLNWTWPPCEIGLFIRCSGQAWLAAISFSRIHDQSPLLVQGVCTVYLVSMGGAASHLHCGARLLSSSAYLRATSAAEFRRIRTRNQSGTCIRNAYNWSRRRRGCGRLHRYKQALLRLPRYSFTGFRAEHIRLPHAIGGRSNFALRLGAYIGDLVDGYRQSRWIRTRVTLLGLWEQADSKRWPVGTVGITPFWTIFPSSPRTWSCQIIHCLLLSFPLSCKACLDCVRKCCLDHMERVSWLYMYAQVGFWWLEGLVAWEISVHCGYLESLSMQVLCNFTFDDRKNITKLISIWKFLLSALIMCCYAYTF